MAQLGAKLPSFRLSLDGTGTTGLKMESYNSPRYSQPMVAVFIQSYVTITTECGFEVVERTRKRVFSMNEKSGWGEQPALTAVAEIGVNIFQPIKKRIVIEKLFNNRRWNEPIVLEKGDVPLDSLLDYPTSYQYYFEATEE